jgi:hypothetical protein
MNFAKKMLAVAFMVICATVCADPAAAQSKGQPRAQAIVFDVPDGPSPFVLTGTAQHFGRFLCYGELEDGAGVAVLMAANGDLIVGVVTGEVDERGLGELHFSWRDSVEFSDGTVVRNTGRFARNRPPGVVIAIIAILIG